MYCEGTIYRIVCNLNINIQYIGSTFDTLSNRWGTHKSFFKFNKDGKNVCCINTYFKQYGIENFSILPIKKYLVYRENKKDNKHLRAYEQLWINKTKCVNINQAFSITKIQRKNFYTLNRDRLLKEKEKYYSRPEVKKRIKEYEKKPESRRKKVIRQNRYYQNNKDKVDKKRKLKIDCICGGKYTKSNKAVHFKTKKHQEFVNHK